MAVGYEQCDKGLKERINTSGDVASSPNYTFTPVWNNIVLNEDSSEVTLGFPGFNPLIDFLIVFKNSVYLTPNEFYTIETDGSKIKATDNETWVSGTKFQFIALCITRVPNALKCVSVKNNKTISQETNSVALDITGFDKDADTLLVFKDGEYLELDIDYTCDNTNIYPKNGGNFTIDADKSESVFAFVVLRNVIDQDLIDSITGNHNRASLDEQNAVSGTGNTVSLSNTIPIEMNGEEVSLQYAFNQLFTSASNGKSAIAGEVGNVNSDNTFNDIATEISEVKQIMVTKLKNKGIEADTSMSLRQLSELM